MMTETKDNIVDRDELQDSYIDAILDDTSAKTMRMIAYDYLNDNLDGYTVDELITEVEDYYPHLLEQLLLPEKQGKMSVNQLKNV